MSAETANLPLTARLDHLADSMDVGGLIASRKGEDNEVCPDACDEYAFVMRAAAAQIRKLEGALRSVHRCGHKTVDCSNCNAIVRNALGAS